MSYNYSPRGVVPTLPSWLPPCSPTPRQRSTVPVGARASGALRRRLLVVDVAVPLVLLAAAHTTGGHTGLTEKDRVEAAPQARTGKSELLRTAWINLGVLMR